MDARPARDPASPMSAPVDSPEQEGISRESSWPTAFSLHDGGVDSRRHSTHGSAAMPLSKEFLDSNQALAFATKVGSMDGFGIAQDAPSVPRTRPLNLLDLPMDILEVIVRVIGSTNDLTSLARTNSSLHAIVVPQMYARFDIVWPEQEDEHDLRGGVDALAYGLSTLLLGPRSMKMHKCGQCGQAPDHTMRGSNAVYQRKLHDYAQFTRKFSLGNGPSKFVQSYYISTESGKMLGTQVALAVSRMKNLEIFTWDMATGIIREVWEALSSLGDHTGDPQTDSKLESIWVRCHDSREVRTPSQNIHFFLAEESLSARPHLLRTSFRQIEHPNFSILPALRCISVLQIDELAYFEELSILVYKSLSRLRELRIGISLLSGLASEYVREVADGTEGTFLAESSLTPLGANGVLGMLMSKFCSCERQQIAPVAAMVPFEESAARATEASLSPPFTAIPNIVPGLALGSDSAPPSSAPPISGSGFTESLMTSPVGAGTQPNPTLISNPPRRLKLARRGDQISSKADKDKDEEGARASKERYERNRGHPKQGLRLKLHIVALENVPLSISVLTKALDWKFLTDVTLLNCHSDDGLWKALAKKFAPQLKASVQSTPTKSPETHEYPLRLRKIHTDGVSAALITFIREHLAPNTLECLFLQDRKDYKPSSKVTIDSIYKGALRRHRASLQKLSIDSGYKHQQVNGSYKKWLLNRDVLTFITSGKMEKLRELAVSVEYKDWHFFLQHLPGLPRLRSLYIPYINEHVHSRNPDAQELALQILDIVTLRPEIELCYIGILAKCFEILEGKGVDAAAASTASPELPLPWNNIPFLNHEESEDSSVTSGETEEEAEAAEDDEDEAYASESEASLSDTSAMSEIGSQAPRLRLREILFFAEKVEIFKVRHGTT